MDTILYLYDRSRDLVAKGMPMSVLKESSIFDRVISIKYDVANRDLDRFEEYRQAIDEFYQEVLENHQIIFQKKIYETRMEHVEKMEKQMSAFRHDLKNHLFALNIMAEENDIEQIKKYLQEMDDSLSRSVTRNYTENKAFDMLLNYFMIKANSADVIIRLTASIPKDLDWNMYDLNIVLGNLIDNAIEGVTYVVEKVIDLNIKYHKGILMIKVENNYNSELKIQEGRYLTTKENHSEEHGFGLENVSKVVEKYSGTMEIHSENNRFKVKLLLYQK